MMAIDSDEEAAEHSIIIININIIHARLYSVINYNYTLQTVYFLFELPFLSFWVGVELSSLRHCE